jgi:hypothetical protein
MIAFLRIVGLLNAAAWFGMAVLVAFAIEPAASSHGMEGVLEVKNFPYYSVAIAHVLIKRCLYFQIAFALIAILHLTAERLYLGRWSQKSWFGLLLGLLLLNLLNTVWLQPHLEQLHKAAFAVNFRPEQRRAALESYRLWHAAASGFSLLVVGGLALYLWRVANPQDSTRFVVGTSAPFQRTERV